MLIINPLTNETDIIRGIGTPGVSAQWTQPAFSPETGKLYAPTYNEPFALIIDPATNSTDYSTLRVTYGTLTKIAYSSATHMMCECVSQRAERSSVNSDVLLWLQIAVSVPAGSCCESIPVQIQPDLFGSLGIGMALGSHSLQSPIRCVRYLPPVAVGHSSFPH